MADEEKKIIVDSDWKAEAQREKERLTQEAEQHEHGPQELPEPNIVEIINLIVMQAAVGLGMMGDPSGKAIPPNLPIAKYFIDLLQVLEDKTKGNLSEDEKKLLEQVLYEMRMRFVQVASGGQAPGGAGSPGGGGAAGGPGLSGLSS